MSNEVPKGEQEQEERNESGVIEDLDLIIERAGEFVALANMLKDKISRKETITGDSGTELSFGNIRVQTGILEETMASQVEDLKSFLK